jgi:hypothetical protein
MGKILRKEDYCEAPRPEISWSSLQTADLELKIKLAESKLSHATTLGVLSHDADERIRAAVADNPSTPGMTLLRLARDKSDDIRYQLAENHNVPVQVLLVMIDDDNPYVRTRAERTLKRLRAHNDTSTSQFPIQSIRAVG